MASQTNSLGIIWTATSVHGNTITLYEVDWEHILEHPEMLGKEDIVRMAVEKPQRTQHGAYPESCAFEIPSSTNPEGLRVLVKHHTELYLDGGTTGFVTTGYPINTTKYVSRVGPVIQQYAEYNRDDEP